MSPGWGAILDNVKRYTGDSKMTKTLCQSPSQWTGVNISVVTIISEIAF